MGPPTLGREGEGLLVGDVETAECIVGIVAGGDRRLYRALQPRLQELEPVELCLGFCGHRSLANAAGRGVGLTLERVAGLRDRQRPALRCSTLLHDVRQLVRQQLPSAGGTRSILPGAEEDIAADGERPRRHRSIESRRMVVEMYADVSERVAERSTDVLSDAPVERVSAAARGCDCRLDIGVHESTAENALAVAHPRDGLRESAVPDRRGQPRQRRRVDGSRGLWRIRHRRPMDLLEAPLELVRFHKLSISLHLILRNRIASRGDVF